MEKTQVKCVYRFWGILYKNGGMLHFCKQPWREDYHYYFCPDGTFVCPEMIEIFFKQVCFDCEEMGTRKWGQKEMGTDLFYSECVDVGLKIVVMPED